MRLVLQRSVKGKLLGILKLDILRAESTAVVHN